MQKIKKLVEKYGGKVREKLLDPIFFTNEIMGFESEPYKLTPYQEEWLRFMESHDRLNFMAFRSSGKTETMLIRYPIFKAFTVPKWQGIIVSNSLKQSTSVLRRVRELILGNEILRTSVPAGRDGLWSKTELQLKNGSMIWSRPNNENLPGEHVDWIGGDEIGYWRDMDIITKVIPPMVRAKNGKIVFIGTPTSQIDAIHELQKNKAFLSKSYPANLKVDDKSLWEMRYPNLSIRKARLEYDSMSWSREFLCKPLGAKDRIYPFELIQKSFDMDAKFQLIKNTHSAYFFGLDFALSAEAGSDYTVYSVLEKVKDVCRLVNMERYKGLSYQAQKARIKQLADIYKPIKVVADEGSFGKSFVQDLRGDSIPVEGFRFTNQSKQDLHTNLRNFFEQSRIIINKDESDIKTQMITKLLVNELSNFGVIYDKEKKAVKFEGLGEHDDMVNSLALACWGAKGGGNISWKVARGSNSPKGLFYLGRVG
jgi:phage terminase large subunit-like protein